MEHHRNLSRYFKIVRIFLRQWIAAKNYRKFFLHDFFSGRQSDHLATEPESASYLQKAIRFLKRPLSWIPRLDVFVEAMVLNNLSLARQQFAIRRDVFVPDHIHCPFLFSWDSRKLKHMRESFPNVPYSVTLRSRDLYAQSADDAHLSLRRFLVENASQVFTISKYNRKNLDPGLKLKSAVQVIHSSIDVDLFTPDTGMPKKFGQLISVARLIPKKGLPLLLEACAILKKQGCDFHLLIVGDGPLKPVLRSKIQELGLVGKVDIAGPFRQKKIRDLLNTAQAFVLPCVIAPDGDRDILPNSIKEAMAMKLPVVTTSISGIEELITDGVDGLLAAPNDAADLAMKMRTALSDQLLSQRLGECARTKILEEFSISGEGEKFNRSIVGLRKRHEVHVPATV
jgi:glycosyltransferase involved in cell wall biosynthesis